MFISKCYRFAAIKGYAEFGLRFKYFNSSTLYLYSNINKVYMVNVQVHIYIPFTHRISNLISNLNLDRLVPAIGIGNSHTSLSTQFMLVGSPVFTKTVEF